MKCFSFIVPVYNCSEYLSNCVKSILEIGLERFEIILVNDGSEDESGRICDEFVLQYNNIRTIHQKNQGVSVARNRGIDAAIGEYIILFDADDTIEPKKLRNVLKIIETDNSIDMMIFGLSFDYYHKGAVYRKDEMAYPTEGIMDVEQWNKEFYQLYIDNSISPVWNKVFRKSIITEHKLKFNEKMFLYEDLEFVIRYMTYCDKIYNSTEVLYHYRQSEDEGNAKRRLARIDSLSEFISQIERPLDDLIFVLNCDEKSRSSIKSILPNLYLVLANEKIAISNQSEIRRICIDMAKWYKDKDPVINQKLSKSDREFIKLITDCRVAKLMLKSKMTAIRHCLALRVKNTRIYRVLRK